MEEPVRPFITAFGDLRPLIHPSAHVDISARIIGDVTLEEGVSVWPMAVLRADSAPITVGRRSAVLDLVLIEAPSGRPVAIGAGSLISHGAILHGAVIGDSALIGIGAVVLDGAVVGPGSIVGARSLVTAGTRIPAGSLVVGSPARIVRNVTDDEGAMIYDQINELFAKSIRYRGNP